MFSVDSLNFTRSSLFVFYSFVFVRTISFLLSALFRYIVIVSVLCPPFVFGVLIQCFCIFFVASSLYRSPILCLSVGCAKIFYRHFHFQVCLLYSLITFVYAYIIQVRTCWNFGRKEKYGKIGRNDCSKMK